ncbi:HEPN domain protein [Ferroglobus placidus DSM 10642]|uniref:HEPN domain protein n=2 Tax=Ferroglobus placidus TaxID=54261 RepID=D3S2Y2_FERPA|nr:HEPN domain protein [Ferroglobus placidus DSM 10642]
MKDFARACLKLAEDFEDTKPVLEHSRLITAVNCAYYAMFHAAQAILAFNGIGPSRTHRDLREVFGKEIILKGLADRELGRVLSRAFELRQASSYEVYAHFGEDVVREIGKKSGGFVKRIKEFMSE